MADDAMTPDIAATVEALQEEVARLRAENASLFSELQDRNAALQESNRQVTESLEQQAATAEVLRVIAASPTDPGVVLGVLVERAARLCDVENVGIFEVRDSNAQVLTWAASHGPLYAERLAQGQTTAVPLSRQHISGRAVIERRVIHVGDLEAVSDDEFAVSKANGRRFGYRAAASAPLIHEGEVIGGMAFIRHEARPFTERQLSLLETFADQAVIAIENARLFQALQDRTTELTQSLEQQTALAEVLRVIASSPTDLDRVLQVVASAARRLCGAEAASVSERVGDMTQTRAVDMRDDGQFPEQPPLPPARPTTRDRAGARAILERRIIHIPDIDAVAEQYPGSFRASRLRGWRSTVAAPLMRGDEAVGALSLYGAEARPFSEKQIALLEAFASQAAIAIENARLFDALEQRNAELQESNQRVTEALEQQTALGEVLRVIASTPTDVQRVLDAIIETAIRLCNAPSGWIQQIRPSDGLLAARATAGSAKQRLTQTYGENYFDLLEGAEPEDGTPSADCFRERRTISIVDLAEAARTQYPALQEVQARWGHRSQVLVPLVHQGEAIGVLIVARFEVRPFSEREIALLEAFADQAVIAIENARLFQELEERTSQLSRSVAELHALGDVGRAVSSSLDLQEVLSTIVANAARLSDSDGGSIYEYDETTETLRRSQPLPLFVPDDVDDDLAQTFRHQPIRLGEGAVGQAVSTRGPIQVPDILVPGAYDSSVRDTLVEAGFRSLLALPLLRQDRPLGALVVVRRTPGAFSSEIVTLLQTFAGQCALAIHNARLYQELETQGRALEEASQHKSQFLANMSHELRTPLNAIIGYSEMLQEEAEDLQEETFLPDLQRINAAGKHLLGLINDILDLSKIEAGKMELALETVDVAGLVHDVSTTVGPLMEKNGNALVVDVASNVGEMVTDPTRLRQILFNLLGNAAKFTDHGQIELRVASCELREENETERVESPSPPLATRYSLLFTVSDTGIGMTEEQLGRLFEAFAQAEATTSRRFGGTGLGLALVRHFSQSLGGDVSVTSTPGQGSTFTVRLPVAGPDAATEGGDG
ncbi:MAG: GAF domain-containing protein [Chloroflexota bacterium]